jgi:type I site-specific restriction endonuclease
VLRRPLTEETEPIPLAIIEAKREGLPPEHGLQQGKGYRVGHLHAVPFVFSSNGHQFVEYDDETGSGKTRIAASLLRRLFDAKLVGRALFVCDRTELRDNGLGGFQESFGTDAAEVDTRNPQLNAKVVVATFQTLDKAQVDEETKFFLKHYPPRYFDVILTPSSAWRP